MQAQERRLPLICSPPNARPTKLSDAMLRQAAEHVMRQFVKDGTLRESDLDGAINDLLEVTYYDRNMGGYEIAKGLERNHHWDCTRDMLEVFDEFSDQCADLLTQAEKEWALENPMEPPFQTGETVVTPHGVGPIEKIHEYGPAKYVVGIKDRHLIVNFEDVGAVVG